MFGIVQMINLIETIKDMTREDMCRGCNKPCQGNTLVKLWGESMVAESLVPKVIIETAS